MKGVEETKSNMKDLAYRVDKVSDTADKIALDNSSYRDVLLSKPTLTNRDNAVRPACALALQLAYFPYC